MLRRWLRSEGELGYVWVSLEEGLIEPPAFGKGLPELSTILSALQEKQWEVVVEVVCLSDEVLPV